MKLELPIELLQCPDCRCGLVDIRTKHDLVCSQCGTSFPLAGNRPVLLRHDNALFSIDAYFRTVTQNQEIRKPKWVPSPSVNLSAERVLSALRTRLDACAAPTKVLVVGGGRQRAWLDRLLIDGTAQRQILYSDIDSGADVDLFCDAHDLPFTDASFDAVVTTAVLEHVLYPERVAEEITRVLKLDGLLYSELPFMQQVHEGAYDFTRYSLSGHRRLFSRFLEIDAGMVAGPGTALAWAIENFALAFFDSKKTRLLVKTFVRIVFSWLKYFDYLLKNNPSAMDGASCTYFLGRKIEERVSDTNIVERYIGAKHLNHT